MYGSAVQRSRSVVTNLFRTEVLRVNNNIFAEPALQVATLRDPVRLRGQVCPKWAGLSRFELASFERIFSSFGGGFALFYLYVWMFFAQTDRHSQAAVRVL